MRNKYQFISVIALFFSACTKPVGIQESGIEAPVVWDNAKDLADDAPLMIDDNAQVEQHWWSHFGDQTLDTLIILALENNKTLSIAKTRIEEARAARIAAISILFPQVNITSDASRGDQGFYTNGNPLSFKNAAAQATWELDLFGKNQARLDAANALVQTETVMRQAVVVGLLAEVARNYFDLVNIKKQIAITRQNLETQQQTYELTEEQLKGALASNFDVQRAGAQVSSTESRIPLLQISYAMTCNRLNVLLGTTPGVNDDLYSMTETLKPLDKQIVVTAPATVLATRPDVRAAERRFATSISEHVAATKELLPSINLLAFFGVQEMTLFNTAPTWNLAANLVQPFLNFGRIESDIKMTSARQLRAYLEYQETVLEALEDMENALANYLYENSRHVSLERAVEQNRKALELANQQYVNGYTGLLDLLIAQRNALDSESNLADSDAKLRKDLVNIYTAAGGGWIY